MEQAIQLFGYLILTFLGFVVPVLGILLSIFHEGILKLTSQYSNEKSQSEKNIKEQLAKVGDEEKIDDKKIKISLKKLNILDRTAKYKLSYLNPKKQILRLFSYLLISFVGIILATLGISLFWTLLLSLLAFGYAIIILWKQFGIIVEVKKIIDCDNEDKNTKIIELLSKLVEKEDKYFLKKVYIRINNKNIDDTATELSFECNKRYEMQIAIINQESRAAKKVEIGFIFTPDFIIEKTNYYTIYTSQSEQIIRYKEDFIQGNTNQNEYPLIVTPLKKGNYKINTFIKAENIESIYRRISLNIE